MSTTKVLDTGLPGNGESAWSDEYTNSEVDEDLLEVETLGEFPAPDPIPYGMTDRPARLADALARFRQQIRLENPTLASNEVARRAKAKLDEYKETIRSNKALAKQFDLLAPTCLSPNRTDVLQAVEIAAMRRLPEMAKFEQQLRGVTSSRSEKNRFNMAMIEHLIFNASVPSLKSSFHAINGGGELVAWAYDDPCATRHPSRVNAAGQAIHKMLQRTDPELTIELNLSAIQRLAAMNPEGRIGRYATIDGTFIEANVLQHQTYSEEHFKVISKKTSATYMQHDEAKKCRGYTLLAITCMKTNLPLVWTLISGQPRSEDVRELMELLFRYWPECPLKYLVGDSEFDYSAYYEMLYQYYGIHGAFVTRKGNSRDHDVLFENGVPRHCSKRKGKNHDGLMSLRLRGSHENWWDPEKRKERGYARGEFVPYANERIRWECRCDACLGDPMDPDELEAFEFSIRNLSPETQAKARQKKRKLATLITRPGVSLSKRKSGADPGLSEGNPRRFTYLPHAGNSKYAVLRDALLMHRNTAEGLFSVMKREQIGLEGCGKARWINTDREMEWMIGGTLMGLTFSRLIHVNGMYQDALEEAASRPTPVYSRISKTAFKRENLMRVVVA